MCPNGCISAVAEVLEAGVPFGTDAASSHAVCVIYKVLSAINISTSQPPRELGSVGVKMGGWQLREGTWLPRDTQPVNGRAKT